MIGMTFFTGGGFTMSPNIELTTGAGVGFAKDGVNAGALGLNAAAPFSNNGVYAPPLTKLGRKLPVLNPAPKPPKPTAELEL
jgi:hypothetical protein